MRDELVAAEACVIDKCIELHFVPHRSVSMKETCPEDLFKIDAARIVQTCSKSKYMFSFKCTVFFLISKHYYRNCNLIE